MKTRVISGIVLAAIGIAVILAGGPVLAAALLFCSVVGMKELFSACGVLKEKEWINPVAAAGYAGAVFYYVMLFCTGSSYAEVSAALAVMCIMTVYVLCFPKYHADQAISAAFSFFYTTVMLGFIYLIRTGNNGLTIVWLVFLASWAADTCAYFAGRAFGKHKMAPVLSPKKTVEGAVGGVVGAGLCGVLFALIFNSREGMWQFFVICAVGAVISIFGDLAASAIKRDHKIKDYGTLIPGHGGIMDRFDSVIFTSPVIYLLSQLLFEKLPL